MNIIELLMISLSLSMDAFSASICKGLNNKKINFRKSLIVGTYFGLFQALMPLIGYILGSFFTNKIEAIDHYLAFFLLSFIGISMIKNTNITDNNQDTCFKEMILISLATSIDALVIGVTFSFLKINLYFSIIIIGIVTFIICLIGYSIGTHFGLKHQKKAQIVGGLILIIMGFKTLIEHLL